MDNTTQAVLLRIFVKEEDRSGERPLYVEIVEEARTHGLAGATVLRGVVGYGASNDARTPQPAELSSEVPMVIEIVDWEDRIEPFREKLGKMMERGLVTMEKVNVTWYQSSS